MKRLICSILIIQITYIITWYAMGKNGYHTHKGIELSDNWWPLSYEDSVFINKQLIDSILLNMYGYYSAIYDTSLIPIGGASAIPNSLGDTYIIKIANVFVVDTAYLDIPISDSYTNCPYGYIKKSDLKKLYQHFSCIQNVEAKDIIDVINLYKQVSQSFIYFTPCINMDIDKWDKICDAYFESIDCKLEKISRKYSYGIIEDTPCPEVYSIAKDSTLTVDERIGQLTCMLDMVTKMHQYDVHDVENHPLVSRWKHDIDSLRSLPICRH